MFLLSFPGPPGLASILPAAMSPDRISELRRQRALIAQHLAWIDAELTTAGAAQAGLASASNPASLASLDLSSAPPAIPSATTAHEPGVAMAHARADEIIEKYRATEALDPKATKRGCLVLFGALFALVGAGLLAIYYFGYAKN